MTFDELVFHNFGVYLGRQAVTLTPPHHQRPVILIGGLNGAGKTTFLDALHLVLYGKRARVTGRARKPWNQFLAESIHRNSPEPEAGLELAFRQRSQGHLHRYRICRSWHTRGGNALRENLEVYRNGQLDRQLTASWDDLVEAFIPLGLSELFLFNGEKIEALAEPRSAAALLKAGIHALLGLDLVDRLTSDLHILERRKHKRLASDAQRLEIDALEHQISELQHRLDELDRERHDLRDHRDILTEQFDAIHSRCKQEGADLFEERTDLERQHAALENELENLEHALRHHAQGIAPLLLIQDLVHHVHTQATREHEAHQTEALTHLLLERDNALLQHARTHNLTQNHLFELEDFLALDRYRRTSDVANVERYLHITPHGLDQLQHLVPHGLQETRSTLHTLLERSRTLQNHVHDQERTLHAVPEREAITSLIQERERTRARLELVQQELSSADDDRAFIQNELDERRATLTRLLARRVEHDFQREDASRILTHAQRVRSTLSRFRHAMLSRHLDHIQDLVLESFQELMRKSTLVEDIRIDPETFLPQLRGHGHTLDPDRLSAGERQLLAVSLLWGLARASGRMLPAVIDTPLGRLDSDHRLHLVNRYFPHASHQVLLLSTDEEIDARYYNELQHAIGREYHLRYDPTQAATRIELGYPFR